MPLAFAAGEVVGVRRLRQDGRRAVEVDRAKVFSNRIVVEQQGNIGRPVEDFLYHC
jgi:hypothetical protein